MLVYLTIIYAVTFGKQSEPLDVEKYQRAISICALEHDIQLLSDGDQTEIGEKGKRHLIGDNGQYQETILIMRASFPTRNHFIRWTESKSCHG